MAEVQIQSVESNISVTDSEALLTPEVVNMLVKIIRQQLDQEKHQQIEANRDRELQEGASR